MREGSGTWVAVLGPVRAQTDGSPIAIPGARVRLLLARLALARGRQVPAEVLIDDLWGADSLADATNTLQALVSRLRKAVGAAAVESASGGYRLVAEVDAPRFEELAARGRRELAAGDPAAAIASLDAALGLWTGAALSDLPDAEFVRAAAGRLAEARLAAVEDRAEAALRLGRPEEVLAEPAEAHPLRERLAALRMRALYEAGRQAEALAVYEQVRRALAEQLGVDPGAELRQVHLAVLRGELEPLAARPQPAAGRLPAQLTSFTGRETELDLLTGQLAAARLVTIVGPGGVGKTRLAIEAAARQPVPARVWFVPLAGAAEVAEAVLGVLSAARVRLGGARQPVLDQLAELIGPEDALLVLDNCEHLVDSAAKFTEELLTRLPGLRILATSREPLAITGEALCRLEPLAQPDAVRLFLDRARAVRPGFAVDETVADICRRLDGLPLALELAAARLRSMTAEQIAARLDDRFRLLTSGSRSALPRHRTLHAVVEWSWDLLTEPERLLAARLSIFPGGAGTVAVEAVCADETLPAEDLVYLLGALVEKSLVQWDGQRYRMLATIRAYAADRLADREPLADRFVRHFLALAEEQEPRLRNRDQLDASRLLDTEHDNLVHALRVAIADGQADAAARLVAALTWYWKMFRLDARAEGFVAEVLAFGDALPSHSRAGLTALHELTAEVTFPGPDRVRALVEDCLATGALTRHPTLLIATAPSAYLAGLHDLAEQQLREAGDPWAAAGGNLLRAFFREDQGDWPGAAALRRQALRGFEECGDRLVLAHTLAAVAQDHAIAGEQQQALAALARSVALVAGPGWAEETAYRAKLGVQRTRAGDPAGARRELDTALRQAVERGEPHLRIEPLVALADLHRRTGDPGRAHELLDGLEASVHGLPGAEQAAAMLIAPVRMATRIDTGDPAAREPLPLVAAVAPARAAELLARLLPPAEAAFALGLSQAIRGAVDRGDPELRALTDELTAQLGPAFALAFGRGAGLSRDQARQRLHTL
ncbi:winged helix-turn-helix domain-containing protein [Crossiella sp. SN42]|uniref:BTAD domain-containing putative transcriptional regulator n=1 Tax=Crossiella sp. SN42 TaxID=2944808 RepID=UPI00207D564D|nr:BTAD domain-containing putative transcriptional regulator [Crossiella sp. SN42]MCO1574330.1 winged helix-turn-helix domain-containing protein [Crossiella sp. SN42]